MIRYADNPVASQALIRPTEVHRDVYDDPENFDLEMKIFFANIWVFVVRNSQAPIWETIFTPKAASNRS